MAKKKLRDNPAFFILMLIIACILLVDVLSPAMARQGRRDKKKIRIFDGKPKVIVVNGYSTSFHWPGILQSKLDRYCSDKRVIEVKYAVKAGTPIAKWINVSTGRPLVPWMTILQPILKEAKVEDKEVIVLAPQSLQWVFGPRGVGIRGPADHERVRQGADALEKYVRLLKKDGADLIFISMHIFKHQMEPQIGNERYALDELMRRDIDSVERGPDVWTPTKRLFPKAFSKDQKHPNELGSELIAQKWFETLLKYDGLRAPAWSIQRLKQAIKPKPVSHRVPPNVKEFKDLEYIPGGHERNKLDLYLPQQLEGSGPLPLIVWIHGGAWRAGSKENCRAVRFLDKGYAVASVNYRLSQHAIFPAQIEDCKAAIRWLRANSGQYGLDPERIGVWGSSAGGHLAALLGTAGDIKEFDVGLNLDVSSRVQAVCDFFGPTDFLQISQSGSDMDHSAADSPVSQLIGGPIRRNKEACKRASPINYVTKDNPPFLIIHGSQDKTVPINQSELIYEALTKKKVPVTFHTVLGAGHGFSNPEVDKMVDDFFDAILKHKYTVPVRK